MSENGGSKRNLWTGGATTAFKVFNWELFVKPRRWLMIGGLVIMVGCCSMMFFEVFNGNEEQKKLEEKKRILQLAREIKEKEKNENKDEIN